MALPALLPTRNQDGAFGSSDYAMFTISHGGGVGRIFFHILAEVHFFIEATNFLDLIFCKIKRKFEKGIKTTTYFFADISRVTRSFTNPRWNARDWRAIDTQTSFTCDQPRGTAAQHIFMCLSFVAGIWGNWGNFSSYFTIFSED